jgi:hypothetical protein
VDIGGYGSRLARSLSSGAHFARPVGLAGTTVENPMDARDVIKIGMSAERKLVVPAERTVGHFVPGMPMVYATPMMILEMELVSGDAINPFL